MADETKLQDLYTFDETTGTIDPVDFTEVEEIVTRDVCDALKVDIEAVEPATPMGRFLDWLAQHFTGVIGLNVQNANQLLVSAATGQQLDAMAQWFQLRRKPSQYSQVLVHCKGAPGTAIPQGSTIRNENGDVFESVSDSVITAAGYVDILFEALVEGPVSVAANTVNILDSVIYGWNSCTNPNPGVVGSNLETDESLRARIVAARTVAAGFLGAIKNAVEKVDAVKSSMVIENNTGNHLAVHGVDMEEHSILVCVDGLLPPDAEGVNENEDVVSVAQAIFDNKPCGTGYTKVIDTSATVENSDGTESPAESSAYQYDVIIKDDYGNPYHVFFCCPIPKNIGVGLQVQKRGYTGIDLTGDVTKAVLEWSAESSFGCGEDVYASDIIKAVENKVPGVVVVECRVSDAGNDKGTSYVEVDAVHKATFDADRISVSLYSR